MFDARDLEILEYSTDCLICKYNVLITDAAVDEPLHTMRGWGRL